jgi:hypothetical protein
MYMNCGARRSSSTSAAAAATVVVIVVIIAAIIFRVYSIAILLARNTRHKFHPFRVNFGPGEGVGDF